MPPYAQRRQPKLTEVQTILRKYDISKKGFLPARTPLDRLPDPLYRPWEDILSQLPDLLERGELHRSVESLEILSTQGLRTEDQWRRAYVVLSFLAHAYIWGGDKASEILPPAITVPYLQVSHHLDLPPVATYAALNLWNFTTSSDDFADLDSLRALHTFSGTEDESWFFCLSVAMECQGARIIPVMLAAIEAIQHHDYQTITDSLEEMRACIVDLGQTLERMHERCDPMTFYDRIRPFLAGSKNAAQMGLPNGVFYDEGSGKGSWRQLRGGSNGQSSLIQFLDVVLGVEHTSSDEAQKKAPSFHEEVRAYMPEPHREFLRHVARMDSLRDFALRPATSEEELRMQRSFQEATAALAEFRGKHMRIVTRYIIVPSRIRRGANTNDAVERNGTTKENGVITGTGGTDLIPFLKQTREETLVAGRISAS